MKFFDRYGRNVREGDTLQNLETGNLLTVQEIDETNISYTIANNPYSPTFQLPLTNDGYNFVLQAPNKSCSQEGR